MTGRLNHGFTGTAGAGAATGAPTGRATGTLGDLAGAATRAATGGRVPGETACATGVAGVAAGAPSLLPGARIVGANSGGAVGAASNDIGLVVGQATSETCGSGASMGAESWAAVIVAWNSVSFGEASAAGATAPSGAVETDLATLVLPSSARCEKKAARSGSREVSCVGANPALVAGAAVPNRYPPNGCSSG